jgi:hypothetical protein
LSTISVETTTQPSVTPEGSLEIVASNYLAHLVYQAIIAYGEPVKVADIAKWIDDEAISMSLVRRSLARHPKKFLTIDRRWDISTRYLDKQRPAQHILEEIVQNFGAPVTAWDAAHEFAVACGRTAEGVLINVERMLRGSGKFAELTVNGNSRYVPIHWLLDVNDDYHTDIDVLFYNFLSADTVATFDGLELDWENAPVEAVEKMLAVSSSTLPRSIDNRIVQFLAWKTLGEDFDAKAIYGALLESDKLVVLPDHKWTDQTSFQAIREFYIEEMKSISDSAEEEEEELDDTQPLTISDADIIEFQHILEDASDHAIRATKLIEEVYEIEEESKTFASDLETVISTMKNNPELFEWVGYDRFRLAGSLPPYIGQIPESLTFPVIPQIETPEGDLPDQLLEDEGFERGLEREVLNAIAQDVNDQEQPDLTVWPEGVSGDSQSIDLVLKSHHKEIGTFPLCQLPIGFIASEPNVVELILRDNKGQTHQVFADQRTQLMYGLGLFDLYSEIAADSGAIIRFEKTSIPGEYLFIDTEETHVDLAISPERLEQLQNYRAEIEQGPTIPTYDIVKYILEHSNSAMSYIALLTEVNIVRRVARRQLASILSSWSGFSHRSGLWSFDPKKASQGFNKAKRKYITA